MAINRHIFLSLLKWLVPAACVLASSTQVSAQSLEQHRRLYLDARAALSAGELTAFRRHLSALEEYPLYPYLVYLQLNRRLASATDEEIADFLDQYGDTPFAEDLRRNWLKLLARRGRWQIFLDNYTTQSDTVLRCYQLQARMQTGNDYLLLEDTRSIWLAGESLPEQCDPAFSRLYESELMSPELVWERIRLAMHNNQTQLAGYLGRYLPPVNRPWLERWQAVYRNPVKETLSAAAFEDSAVVRDVLAHGMERLARTDINTAIVRWETLAEKFNFDNEQRSAIERSLAIWAVIKQHPQSADLLDRRDYTDDDMFHWRLRDALEQNDWSRLVKWTEGTPSDEATRLRWQYWRARALEQTGNYQKAEELYGQLAGERDYYGFMAADRISVDYNMSHIPLQEDPETWHSLSEDGGIKRAQEFYLTHDYYLARREWHYALRDMSAQELQIAAMMASKWGWHDRTILALGQAKAYDDLELRFPILFENEMNNSTRQFNLDKGWVFALTRAESAFMTDARSPAGALGLMQVMPATGRETARIIKLDNFTSDDLLQAGKNINIGSAYLSQVYSRFNNMILATAAYNAGPNAVAGWLPESECMEPDIWVEKIPYTETRKYVARILFYATVYDWRLKNEVTRINERMAIIPPKPKNRQVADLSCPASSNITRL